MFQTASEQEFGSRWASLQRLVCRTFLKFVLFGVMGGCTDLGFLLVRRASATLFKYELNWGFWSKPASMSSEESPADLDELYFGSVPVHLASVGGETIAYSHDEWGPVSDPPAIRTVLERAGRFGPNNDIIVPAIPALDIARLADRSDNPDSEDVSVWPAALRTPLLKVHPESGVPCPDGILKAMASGVRSCVLKTAEGWFRLKGCGNFSDGFIVREVADPLVTADSEVKAVTRQVRGSAWLHTALRENYVLAQLAKALEPQGIIGANAAHGVYLYGPPNQPFGPAVSVPACVVCKTLGDRRLGTHVLAGLELLLPQLLDTTTLDAKALIAEFPPARTALHSIGDPIVSTATLMCDHMLAFEFGVLGMVEETSQGLDFAVPRDGTSMANGSALKLKHQPLRKGVYPRQWTEKGSKEMDCRWWDLWDRCVGDYNTALARLEDKSPLGYLYSRLGNDCGKILKAMHGQRISWGTYQDELCVDPSQWHCNAHANNLVILSEATGTDMFVGYLDLDMAFDDATFVSVYGKGSPKGTVGTPVADHDILLKREHVNFMEVLAGADASSGVPSVAASVIEAHSDELKLAKTALVDGLILGYRSAYDGPSEKYPVAPFDPDLQEAGHALIKLAIIVMADFLP